ncbi:autotransporter domain-containing protein [Pseudomonas viridiflava]|uniref:autotransporter family protein n=1 Tax=Pseudomonas viridiflava TaxID=33069 RepID=UPI000F06C53A|nr:autotransporter domain-containing protein [Pseudomonas viridiflava]
MTAVIFRKTLLAMAVAATAIPAFAETVQLTNAGYNSERQAHTGNLEINGAYTGSTVKDAIKLSGSTVDKDLIFNANINNSGNLAGGEEAKGVSLQGGRIVGSVINRRLIDVTSTGATALDVATSLAVFENHGSISATGTGSKGLRIDGATITGSNAYITNAGTIRGDGAAIAIGTTRYSISNAQPWFIERGDFNIYNTGSIISAGRAIDASKSNRPVELILRKGSVVVGNLIDLSNIELEGDTSFAGTDSHTDGYNIRLKTGGEVYVGGTSSSPTTMTFESTHTSINGDLYVDGNSALGLNLSNATDTKTAVLKVTGTTQFEQGAQVKLAAKGDDFNANGTTYKLIEAGKIELLGKDGTAVDSAGKLDVVSTSALLKIDSYTVDGKNVVAVVTGKGREEVAQVVADNGGSVNEQATLVTLTGDSIVSRLNDSDSFKQLLLNADGGQVAKLASELAPEVSGGARSAATTSQSLISNVTGSRTSSIRGASSGEGFKDAGVWVQSLYSDATQDRRDGIAGYNAYGNGIAVGADGKVNENLTLGLAYSFINTDVNGKSGNKTNVDSHAFTLYGGFEKGNYFVDTSLTYGFNDNQSKRSIAGTRAKADYDSDLLGLNLVGGYTYHVSPQVLIEPRLAARYSQVNIDGYREKGSSAALKVEDQRYEAIELGAGMRVAGSFSLGAGTLEPQAKLMAYHDFAADEAQSTSTFLLGSTPFVTTGAKAVRDSYEAGVGADYKLGAVTLGVNYDYIGKSGFDADVFSAKVRYDF